MFLSYWLFILRLISEGEGPHILPFTLHPIRLHILLGFPYSFISSVFGPCLLTLIRVTFHVSAPSLFCLFSMFSLWFHSVLYMTSVTSASALLLYDLNSFQFSWNISGPQQPLERLMWNKRGEEALDVLKTGPLCESCWMASEPLGCGCQTESWPVIKGLKLWKLQML